jgi:ERCC4-type nuclease
MISMKEDSGQVTTLATFPGIGHVRARILLQKYTLKQLLNMDRKELEKLVGTVTAGKMRAHYETTG